MSQPIVVMKFGGTSVGSTEAVRAAAAEVRACKGRGEIPIVVVSAPNGITDKLDAFAKHPEWTPDMAVELVSVFVSRMQAIYGPLIGEVGIESWIRVQLAHAIISASEPVSSRAFILSLGEYASATLFATALQAVVDISADPVYTKDCLEAEATSSLLEATPLPEQPALARALQVLLEVSEGCTPVVTGFVGRCGQLVALLGRGGSDYTASIVGEAIGATRIEIWTDVDGMFTADPRVVPRAQRIPRIGYGLATELAASGAKVIHPKTLIPAMRAGIPVFIRNTRRATQEGTAIVPDDQVTRHDRGFARGIAVRKNMSAFLLRSPLLVEGVGILERAMSAFRVAGFDLDYIDSSEASVRIAAADGPEELEPFLASLADIVEAEYEGRTAVITYVHEGGKIADHIRAVGILADLNVPISGASFGNRGRFQLLVSNDHADDVTRALHAQLIEPFNSFSP